MVHLSVAIYEINHMMYAIEMTLGWCFTKASKILKIFFTNLCDTYNFYATSKPYDFLSHTIIYWHCLNSNHFSSSPQFIVSRIHYIQVRVRCNKWILAHKKVMSNLGDVLWPSLCPYTVINPMLLTYLLWYMRPGYVFKAAWARWSLTRTSVNGDSLRTESF